MLSSVTLNANGQVTMIVMNSSSQLYESQQFHTSSQAMAFVFVIVVVFFYGVSSSLWSTVSRVKSLYDRFLKVFSYLLVFVNVFVIVFFWSGNVSSSLLLNF